MVRLYNTRGTGGGVSTFCDTPGEGLRGGCQTLSHTRGGRCVSRLRNTLWGGGVSDYILHLGAGGGSSYYVPVYNTPGGEEGESKEGKV